MPQWSGPDSHGGLGGSPGEVAEWSKANDSKSFEGKPSVGSNPTLSVFRLKTGFPRVPVMSRLFQRPTALQQPSVQEWLVLQERG